MATRFFRKRWSDKTFEVVNFNCVHYFQAMGINTGINWVTSELSIYNEATIIPDKEAHQLIDKWNTLSNGEWIYRLDAPPEIK